MLKEQWTKKNKMNLKRVEFTNLIFAIVCVHFSLFSVSGSHMRNMEPAKILKESLINATVPTFHTRSLIECYLACFDSVSTCFSLSFNRLSLICYINFDDSISTVLPELNCLTIFPSETPTATEPTSDLASMEVTSTIALTTSALITTTTATPIACPSGYTRFETKCYKVDRTSQKSVSDAIASCDSETADLLSIETSEEQEFIHILITGSGPLNNFWISGRGNGAGKFYWTSTNNFFVYENFGTGLPNGDYTTDTCVYMEALENYKWQLDSCSVGVNRYICEYPKTI